MAIIAHIAYNDNPKPVKGTAGLPCHLPGAPATVSALAAATGGIGSGTFVQSATDPKITKIKQTVKTKKHK